MKTVATSNSYIFEIDESNNRLQKPNAIGEWLRQLDTSWNVLLNSLKK